MSRIEVNLPGHSYAIEIEIGLHQSLGDRVKAVAGAARVLLAVDSNIAASHGEGALRSLRGAGFDVRSHELVADESQKSLEAARGLYEAMIATKLERGSFVIALGGGIVGDVAGFAAATYMRGVPVVQAPTTLLAMVDAAIGGKTGVNFARSDGTLVKNIIGAFWQPRAVLIDPAVLETLDDRCFRCGLAECVKHGMIADADLLTFIEKNASRILAKDLEVIAELIERSARIKAAIVQEDERETGRRALLNLGHTFGHAIEPMPELDLEHGEAVAIGLVAAMQCSIETRRLGKNDAERIQSLLHKLGLPTRLPRPVPIQAIRDAMAYDKKVVGGRRRIIVPIGLGKAEMVADVPEKVVDAALRHIGAME